ncbi:ananain-like [Miscanthus floridulus]|uniref:ananain-like n=1 Tax=Miscanthus floridulus TaxID=154761 RepID=UPI00345B34C7
MGAASRCLALALLCTSFLLASAAASREMLMMTNRFHAWRAAHNWTYATAAKRQRRFEVYRRNVEYIEATNRRGGLSYQLGENQFTDLTSDEFLAAYTMPPGQVLAARDDEAVARQLNAATPRDEGGRCWLLRSSTT